LPTKHTNLTKNEENYFDFVLFFREFGVFRGQKNSFQTASKDFLGRMRIAKKLHDTLF